ncbi:transporter C11D3.18C [Salix suchowensis]|nr:transporter C11D3.18C [Salix suchowensis]
MPILRYGPEERVSHASHRRRYFQFDVSVFIPRSRCVNSYWLAKGFQYLHLAQGTLVSQLRQAPGAPTNQTEGNAKLQVSGPAAVVRPSDASATSSLVLKRFRPSRYALNSLLKLTSVDDHTLDGFLDSNGACQDVCRKTSFELLRLPPFLDTPACGSAYLLGVQRQAYSLASRALNHRHVASHSGIRDTCCNTGLAYSLALHLYPVHCLCTMNHSSSLLLGAFSGLLAFGISFMSGTKGLLGWSWIFVRFRAVISLMAYLIPRQIIEGIATVAVGILAFFGIISAGVPHN